MAQAWRDQARAPLIGHAVDPLIVTAALDPTAARILGDLRQRHFPASRNIVPAHLTLFHHLPGDMRIACLEHMEAERPASGAMPFATAAPHFLGRGVAIAIACPPLESLRARLATRWAAVLTPQDRQRFRPHVTIQNKASATVARALFDAMVDGFAPLAGTVTGLDLWWYRDGPWEPAGRIDWAAADGGGQNSAQLS